MSGIKVNGEWRVPGLVHAKVDNVWRIGATTHAKIDGVWRVTTFGAPPAKPSLSYVTTGTFVINGYDSTLVYEPVLVSGGGTASFNATNQRYTLSNEDAAFNIIARYAVGAPGSTPTLIERKKYSFSCRTVPQTCCESCCQLEGGNCFCVPGPCPSDCPPNGQCGCGGDFPCTCGSIGDVVCRDCNCRDCSFQVCDVLINEPGYINSGTEWYRIV
jgi:hypothetical protein